MKKFIQWLAKVFNANIVVKEKEVEIVERYIYDVHGVIDHDVIIKGNLTVEGNVTIEGGLSAKGYITSNSKNTELL